MNKKIIISTLLGLFVFAFIISSLPATTANTDIILGNANVVSGTKTMSSVTCVYYAQMINITQNAQVTSAYVEYQNYNSYGLTHHGTLSAEIRSVDGGTYGSNMKPTTNILATATNTFDNYGVSYTIKTSILFNFSPLTVTANEKIALVIHYDDLGDANNAILVTGDGNVGYGGNTATGISGSTWATDGNQMKFLLLGQDDTPAPTAQPPTDSVGVKFTVNGSNAYNTHANITWSIPDGNGNSFTTPIVGNDGTDSTLYFKHTQDILIKTQIANGYYFYNFSLSATGYSFVYPIDNWLITLDSAKSVYNFDLVYGTVANLVNITLNDGAHGSIYFQYITGDSVQQGDTGDVISGSDTTKYGAGTYHVNRYSTMHIGALCNTGYKVSYYDEYANGIHQKITSLPLTIIATTDMIITPYYVIDTGDGSTVNYDNSALMNFFVYFLLLFVPPLTIAGMLGRYTHSGAGAVIGFVGGLILMLVVGVIVGFIPFWAIIVIVIMLVIFLFVIFRGIVG